MSPRSLCAVGDECGFQLPVHPFYHVVGFGVVGRRMVNCGTKELVTGGEEEVSDRGTSVRCNVLGDTESGDPCREEGSSAGGTINDGEEVSVAF